MKVHKSKRTLIVTNRRAQPASMACIYDVASLLLLATLLRLELT